MTRPTVALMTLLAATAITLPVIPGAQARADDRSPTAQWSWPAEPHLVLKPFAVGPYPWSPGHRGVDLAVVPGQPVRAPSAGVVTFSGVVAGRGIVVVTHTPGGALRSSFEPVLGSPPLGTPVTAGATIATVAPSLRRTDHCSSGGCLHWGLRRGDTYLDPLGFVEPQAIVLLPNSGAGSAGDPAGSAGRCARPSALAQVTSASLPRSWSTALVCIWQIRDSVTPSTRPISASVSPS
jgi:murein DD-endopeptidase MepM/ murein hydrolase activator NlpD